MTKDMCAVIHAEGVRAAMPYIIGFAALLLTGCTVALFIPVLTLVRKICISLGCIKVRSWYSYDDTDDDALLDCDAKTKMREVSQVVFAKNPEDAKGEEYRNVDAPIPIHAKELTVTPVYGAALHAADEKVLLSTRCALVDTINILVNANNTYFIIMLFLMITIVWHFGIFVMDVGMRFVEYNFMVRAFEEAKNAINASAATVEPLTTVVNKFKEVAKP